MELTTYQQLDVRELDCQPLGTIGGNAYYEVHQIVRDDGQKREIIGRASDWPIISRDARIAELEQRVKDLEHLIEETPIIPQVVAAAATGMPRPPIETDDGKVACDVCGQRLKPRGLLNHKRMAHGHTLLNSPAEPDPSEPAEPAWACQECGATDRRSVTEPTHCKTCVRKRLTAIRVVPDNPAWRCAEPGCTGAFTRSLTSPDYCAKHAPATNGHQVAA